MPTEGGHGGKAVGQVESDALQEGHRLAEHLLDERRHVLDGRGPAGESLALRRLNECHETLRGNRTLPTSLQTAAGLDLPVVPATPTPEAVRCCFKGLRFVARLTEQSDQSPRLVAAETV